MTRVDDMELDEALFEMYKKEKIKELKRKFGVVDNATVIRSKDNVSFSGLCHYLSEVLLFLSPEQREVISNNGFGSLLHFEKCNIPNNFVRWVVEHIDPTLSALIVKEKQIPFDKGSVHKILGLPIGGGKVPSESDLGSTILLSKFCLEELPDVVYFVDKLKNKESISDEMLLFCFLGVAMSCFLCPNSNGKLNTSYMGVFGGTKSIKDFDWSMFVYDWLIDGVSYFKYGTGKPPKSSTVDAKILFGGCSYFICVLYLDCLKFGYFGVSVSLPRITVWGGNMIKFYSDLDLCDGNQYGKRGLKDAIDTQYSLHGPPILDVYNKEDTSYQPSSIFRDMLHNSIGEDITSNLKTVLCDIVDAHCSGIPVKYQKHFVRLAVTVAKAMLNSKIDGFGIPPNFAHQAPAAETGVAVVDDFSKPDQGQKSSFQLSTPIFVTKCSEDLNIQCAKVVKRKRQKKFNATPLPFNLNDDVFPIEVVDVDLTNLSTAKNSRTTKHFQEKEKLKFIHLDDSQNADTSRKQVGTLSPDVELVGEMKFVDKLRPMCNKSDTLYNMDFKGSLIHATTKLHDAATTRNPDVLSNLSYVSGPVVVTPAQNYPNRRGNGNRFHINSIERSLYSAVCHFTTHKNYSNEICVDIGGCYVKFFALGESMVMHGRVCSFVINCLCRKFFLDESPTVSLKHFFFSCVSYVFLNGSTDYSYVEKCFQGAASVLPLPVCEMLFFPTCHGDHWFLFIVDLKNKYFLFLDSLFSKDAKFSIETRRTLIHGFCKAWDMFVGSSVDFSQFRVAYPHVPRQSNKYDCSVFVMKFMELWRFNTKLVESFSQEDIPNLRIQITHDLITSKHNKADKELMRKLHEMAGQLEV